MPAAFSEEIHEKAKVIAIQVGYREAARQLELNENTILTWAHREGWSEQVKAVESAILTKHENQGVKSAAIRDSGELMASYRGKTKLSQAKTVYKTAKAFSRLSGDALMAKTQEVKNNVDSASKLWPEQAETPQTMIAIQLNGYIPPLA